MSGMMHEGILVRGRAVVALALSFLIALAIASFVPAAAWAQGDSQTGPGGSMEVAVQASSKTLPKAVKAARSAVFRLGCELELDSIRYRYASYSCFLISDDMVLTSVDCAHPGAFDMPGYGRLDEQAVLASTMYTIETAEHANVPAMLVAYFDRMGVAVLKLEQKLDGAKALPLRLQSGVRKGKAVYALGRVSPGPGQIAAKGSVASVKKATVKAKKKQVAVKGKRVRRIATNASSAELCGGPLLDADGCVVGVNLAESSGKASLHAPVLKKLVAALDYIGPRYELR